MQKQLELICLTSLGMGLIALMCAIVVQVICSALNLNPLVSFEQPQILLGSAISLNTLLDVQWHLLVIAGLLPAGIVWLMDRHVRVDFIYENRTERTKTKINLIGNLVFAGPFFALVLPASWNFMMRAWSSDEGTRNGGLNDLWFIKAVIPLGLSLLALAVLIETLRLFRALR